MPKHGAREQVHSPKSRHLDNPQTTAQRNSVAMATEMWRHQFPWQLAVINAAFRWRTVIITA